MRGYKTMSASSLEHKTVRPGSLLGYSYYYSKQQTRNQTKDKKKFAATKAQRGYRSMLFLAVLLVLAGGIYMRFYGNSKVSNSSSSNTASKSPTQNPSQTTPTSTPAPAASAAAGSNSCAGNTVNKQVIVSISQRHMWACQQGTVAYDSPVVTGISYLAADLTPIGTYRVYEKTTSTHLVGSDSTGSWNDYVYYWMPFLHNQYGSYGFHDATWRPSSDFGNISPDSANASHGCVELPLSSAKWLYKWVEVGTAVTINS